MSTPIDAYQGSYNYPASIRFGVGRISELAEVCRELGMAHPLLVTDPGLARLPFIDEARKANEKAGLPTGLYCEVRPNPIGKNIDDGVQVYRHGHHDGVISFGGGSALDVGKAIALMAEQDRPLWDFEDLGDNYKRVRVEGIAPHMAVPTTSGTGSEVGRSSVIIDEESQAKKIIFHPRMQPSHVICDPQLTVGLPPGLTAAVGMDALSHNLEAYCSPFFHPMGDGIAIEGMRLVHLALKDAFIDGRDLVARSRMMMASTMGATAFQKGLGAMHAVGHAVGALFDTHHGTTMATLMPYVLLLNRPAIADKATAIARYLDLADKSFDGLLAWVLELREQLDMPKTLQDLGVSEASFASLAKKAAADPTAPSNPVPLNEATLRALIERAYEGDLSAL